MASRGITADIHPERARELGPPPALLTRLLRIPAQEASFARRGFRGGDRAARERLEGIGEVFLRGHRVALETSPAQIAARLASLDEERRGFAYEGAAMGLALVGILRPWRFTAFDAFRRGDGEKHRYMVHVGAGWALAALRVPLGPVLRRLDPLLQWLAVDGFGFSRGYFGPARHLERQHVPRRLRGYERRAFDQGLGRAAWFACGAEVAAVTRAIALFPAGRRDDLWSGVGLACAYAGGASEHALRALRLAAHAHRPSLAQGACFAAGARQGAGNPACHTDLVCGELLGLTAASAAALTAEALEGLPSTPASYEEWRLRIRARFA